MTPIAPSASRPRAIPAAALVDAPADPLAARRALGIAVGLRAEECTEVMDARLAAAGWRGRPPSEAYLARVHAMNWFGTVLITRWMVCGLMESEDEKAWQAERGSMVASQQLGLFNLASAYYTWRDVLSTFLRDEAKRLATPPEELAVVLWVVRMNADRALMRLMRAFDARLLSISDQLTEERKVLKHLAFHDQLTGLPNRMLLYDRLEQAVLAAKRGPEFAILLIDLDGFKAVNDGLGHHFGDLVLQQAATRLTEAVRESDTVARLGGDEFLAILVGATLAGAEATAARMLADLGRPLVIDGETVTVGASIGIAVHPANGQATDDLIVAADNAMYQVKKRGRGGMLAATAVDDLVAQAGSPDL